MVHHARFSKRSYNIIFLKWSHWCPQISSSLNKLKKFLKKMCSNNILLISLFIKFMRKCCIYT
jgi:hypothetical protein